MNFVVRKGKKQIAFSMPARALHHFLRSSRIGWKPQPPE
jgi:hypothetical protein